jgi:signal transduction histidine kinase
VRAESAIVSYGDGRYFGTPGGRRCVARGSIGAGQGRTTNNRGRDGRDNRARLNQPLAAIVSNGSAGLRWLDRPEPNLEEARLAFERVVSEGHRAAHIITGIRAMIRKDSGDRSPVAVNELVRDVVSTSLGELKSRRVSLALQLLDDLSPVQADRVQL